MFGLSRLFERKRSPEVPEAEWDPVDLLRQRIGQIDVSNLSSGDASAVVDYIAHLLANRKPGDTSRQSDLVLSFRDIDLAFKHYIAELGYACHVGAQRWQQVRDLAKTMDGCWLDLLITTVPDDVYEAWVSLPDVSSHGLPKPKRPMWIGDPSKYQHVESNVAYLGFCEGLTGVEDGKAGYGMLTRYRAIKAWENSE